MMDEKHMVIVNADGEETEAEILLTFSSPDGQKNFVLIADPDDEEGAFAFQYNEDGELFEITDPEDFRMCEEVLGAYEDQENGDGF